MIQYTITVTTKTNIIVIALALTAAIIFPTLAASGAFAITTTELIDFFSQALTIELDAYDFVYTSLKIGGI